MTKKEITIGVTKNTCHLTIITSIVIISVAVILTVILIFDHCHWLHPPSPLTVGSC